MDAAWGGAAVLSPLLRPHLAGIERADSITCDAHKWFSVSMGAGMFFCRHREAVREAFRAETSYMPGKTSDVLDPFTSTVQWSRRFIGLKLFLALAERGEAGYVEIIERQARLGDLLRDCLARGRLDDRQRDAAAARLLPPRWRQPVAIPEGDVRAADRVDVRGPARRRRTRAQGVRHQLSGPPTPTCAPSCAR